LKDDLEKLLHHTFYNELRIAPEEHPLLIADDPFTPKENREKLTQIVFETFSVPSFCLVLAPVLSLAQLGLSTGIVIESGDHSYIAPVHEGYCLRDGLESFGVGAKELTNSLSTVVKEKGYSLQIEFINSVKQSFCFVSQDYKRDMNMDDLLFNKSVELPDGSILELGKECFKTPEILFQPSLAGYEFGGIHQALQNSIQKLPIDIRDEFYTQIVLSGGNTCFPGFTSRLKKEMEKLSSKVCQIHSPLNRVLGSWIGGSILSCREEFSERFISSNQYNEFGPSIIHQKCY